MIPNLCSFSHTRLPEISRAFLKVLVEHSSKNSQVAVLVQKRIRPMRMLFKTHIALQLVPFFRRWVKIFYSLSKHSSAPTLSHHWTKYWQYRGKESQGPHKFTVWQKRKTKKQIQWVFWSILKNTADTLRGLWGRWAPKQIPRVTSETLQGRSRHMALPLPRWMISSPKLNLSEP